MIRNDILSFTITNTTGSALPVNILGNPSNLADNANATTLYLWDVTSLVLTTENTIELQYAITGSPTYQTITIPFSGTTRQDVVNALNTLNLGGFGLVLSGGNWFIFNYNLTYQFGYLNIYNPAIVPTTFAGFLTNAGDVLNYEINAVNQVTFAGAVPISGTYNGAVGDTFNINGTSGAGALTLWVYQLPDNILLTNINIGAATPFNFNWVALATKNYSVQSFP